MIPGNANPLLLASAAAAAADTEFSIQKSVRFNDDDSAHFSKTPSSAGNRRTFTWSGWFKRSTIDGTHVLFAAGSDANNRFALRFSSGQLFIVDQVGGSAIIRNRTEQEFRDPASWYHFVVAIDSTQSTSSDRLKLYVNGSVVEDYDITNYPSQNQQFNVNSTDEHYIGKRVAENQYFDGMMANVHFIDGLGLAASDFGFYDDNNVWRPKEYTGTFGTNGFHLFDFANESTLGHDSSGNNNDWTANNFSTSAGAGNDVLFDSPTNGDQSDTGAGGEVSGNYCTWNPLVGRYNDAGQSGTAPTFSNGNLNVSGGQTNDRIAGTFHFNVGQSGKYYWEVTFTGTPVSSNGAGVRDYSAGTSTQVLKLWYYNASTTDGGPSTSFASGDVLGFAMDLSAGTIDCYKNGGSSVGQMDISSLTSVTPFVSTNNGVEVVANFGQRAWAYSAPSNYKALCTTNLPTPTIADGSDYFDAVTYTGNGTTAHSITGLSLASAPDLVWIKQRNATRDHVLQDIIRGTGVFLSTNTFAADQSNGGTGSSSLGIQSFDSNGFTLGTGTGVNTSSGSYVAWAWDAGSSNTSISAGSSNSSAYDSSQTWSNGWDSNLNSSFPGTRSFDGDISTGGVVALGSTATWTVPNSGYAISSSLRVYGRLETSNGGFTITFSDSSTSTIPVNATKQWHTISGAAGKTITSIAVTKHENGDEGIFHAVEIDGKILLDNGVTPVDNFPSIASTVRVNQTAGFSIVSYTGDGNNATIGHGLNAAPEFIIQKRRSQIQDWNVYHSANGKDKSIILNSTAASYSSTTWNNTAPTSSVFSIVAVANPSGQTHIAYCFAPVAGYSAFGSYTGNGSSSDGPFVHTGFRPSLIILKPSSGTGNWTFFDTTRDNYNVAISRLHPNLSDAEATNNTIDILSNGFKLYRAGLTENSNGVTYIYAAFAENPFQANGGLAR